MQCITTLKQLHIVALKRKAVVYGICKRRVPAAFLINWSGHYLLQVFNAGVYVYNKGEKNERQGINGQGKLG